MMKRMISVWLAAAMLMLLLCIPVSAAGNPGPYPIAVDGGANHTVVLFSDGTVKAIGDNSYGQCNVQGWTNITQISTSFNHTVGLRADGTVVAAGDNSSGQCNVDGWSSIRKVAAGEAHTLGLRWDGTVVCVGSNRDHQCNVSKWKDISDIAAAKVNSAGVLPSGEVIVRGAFTDQEGYHIFGFRNVDKIFTGTGYFAGLRKDGTVVGFGHNTYPDGTGYLDDISVDGWNRIVGIAIGRCNIFGLTEDGTVRVSGRNDYGQKDKIAAWGNLKAIGAGLNHVIGICKDGSLLAAGDTAYGKCDVHLLYQGSASNDSSDLNGLPFAYKTGKLWTRSETAPSTHVDTKASAPGCWANTEVPGNTAGPVTDNQGNRYSFGLHMDGSDTQVYSITFALNGQYSTFSGVCAYPGKVINDTWTPKYTKYFQVYGDGRLLFTSNTMSAKAAPEPFAISVSGVQLLTVAWPAVDGPNEVATLFDPQLR